MYPTNTKRNLIMAKSPASQPPAIEITPGPRWTVTITPVGNEAQLNVEVHAKGVTTVEVAHYLSKAVSLFTQQVATLPTGDEVAARRTAEALAKAHPATRILVRDGHQRWIGADVPASVVTRLVAAGWIDAGAPPEGVVRGCDYAQDPQAFEATCLAESADAPLA